MRLIDADALLDNLKKLLEQKDTEAGFTGNRNCTVTWDDAIYAIKTAPTVKLII